MHSGTVLFFNKISTSVHIFIYLKINKLSINILKKRDLAHDFLVNFT